MPRKSKYNWPQLIQEQTVSGLSQSQFCKDRNLNPKYFSLQKSKQAKLASSSFLKAHVDVPVGRSDSSSIELVLAQGTLRFGASVSPATIASLLKALS